MTDAFTALRGIGARDRIRNGGSQRQLRAIELELGLVPLLVDCPGSILKIWLLESPYFLPMLLACKFVPVR